MPSQKLLAAKAWDVLTNAGAIAPETDELVHWALEKLDRPNPLLGCLVTSAGSVIVDTLHIRTTTGPSSAYVRATNSAKARKVAGISRSAAIIKLTTQLQEPLITVMFSDICEGNTATGRPHHPALSTRRQRAKLQAAERLTFRMNRATAHNLRVDVHAAIVEPSGIYDPAATRALGETSDHPTRVVTTGGVQISLVDTPRQPQAVWEITHPVTT